MCKRFANADRPAIWGEAMEGAAHIGVAIVPVQPLNIAAGRRDFRGFSESGDAPGLKSNVISARPPLVWPGDQLIPKERSFP